MRSLFVAFIVLGCGIIASTTYARKTYTLEEIESLKNAGVLTGSERYIMISGDDAGALTGGVNATPSLIPADEKNSHSVSEGVIAYDRIGTARFLITMSREYYGDPNLWPYIYEENRAKFGHPDKIAPGTTALVPSLKKYGVNPKNPSDIEKAKRKVKEIYTRYGKHI